MHLSKEIHRIFAVGGGNMVVMLVGCLVLGDDPNTIVLFLLYETYSAGVFVPG